MRKFFLNILIVFISFSFISFANSENEEVNQAELNFFTGMFDFSDDSDEPIKHPLIEEIFTGKKGSGYFKLSN